MRQGGGRKTAFRRVSLMPCHEGSLLPAFCYQRRRFRIRERQPGQPPLHVRNMPMFEDSNHPVARKKLGRPATGQNPALTFRLTPRFIEVIDDWRSRERDKPSRSEAIRWLISKGLQFRSTKSQKMSAHSCYCTVREGLAKTAP